MRWFTEAQRSPPPPPVVQRLHYYCVPFYVTFPCWNQLLLLCLVGNLNTPEPTWARQNVASFHDSEHLPVLMVDMCHIGNTASPRCVRVPLTSCPLEWASSHIHSDPLTPVPGTPKLSPVYDTLAVEPPSGPLSSFSCSVLLLWQYSPWFPQ